MSVNMSDNLSLARDVRSESLYHMSNAKTAAEREIIHKTALEIIGAIEKHASTPQEKSSIRETMNFKASSPVSAQIFDTKEQIKGDGHCLYRSTAHGLSDLSASDTTFIPKLQAKQRELEKSPKKADKKLAVDLGRFIRDLPYGRRQSDQLVQDLRNLSAAYQEAIAPNGVEEGSEYLQGIRGNAWGTAADLSAFSRLFGVRVDVMNGPEKRTEVIGSKTDPAICLEFTGGHYNLIRT